MNPLLPRYFFMADAEARVMPDGRLYLYGSQDISGSEDYCSKEYHVFSTDDPALEKWTDHGISLSNRKDNPGIAFSADTTLYAPDGIYCNGKYYLCACGADNFEAILESDSPSGPFVNAKKIIGASGDSIDPAIFVDDDGQVYYFWGQFRLKGAKLNADMETLDMDSLNKEVLTEFEHGFHEGASIRKHNGKYYMVYTDISRGSATCLSYATSDFPLGPYKKGGTIIDNICCDPQTWNNHGSIECFHGQWYVFYHRSSQNSRTSRRVCAEPIYFNEDGSIQEVIMTSQGASDAISAVQRIDASLACRVKGNVYVAPDEKSEENEVLLNGGGGNWIEDWAEYRYINFGDGVFSWKISAKGQGRISVMAEDYGISGTIDISTDEFTEFSGMLTQAVSGTKAVWLLMSGQEISVDWFCFGKAGN